MVMYRRNRIAGATYFFTVTLRNRQSDLLVSHIDDLRHAFRTTKQKYPFTIDALVVLPEHLHALFTLPEADHDYSTRWREIKSCFVRRLKHKDLEADYSNKSSARIWQNRFWEHTIRDQRDYATHFNYIHINPVKHGLVTRVADWPHSSFHRYVKQGILNVDWSGDALNATDAGFGERA